MDVVVSVLQSIDRESITTKDHIPEEELDSYIKLPESNYYIKKDSKAIDTNKDVDLEEVNKFIEKYKFLTQERTVEKEQTTTKQQTVEKEQATTKEKISSEFNSLSKCLSAESGKPPSEIKDTPHGEQKHKPYA